MKSVSGPLTNWEYSNMSIDKHLAYGPEHHAIEAVMRMHSVKRWHMIDTTRNQNLAEHSANVAMLAMTIALTAPLQFFDSPYVIAAAALVHDLPEAFTGDIPTHTKPHLFGLEELEDVVFPFMFRVKISERSQGLLKLCDIADGIRFIRLHGVDGTAKHAMKGLEEQLLLRLDTAQNKWSANAYNVTRNALMFYAYEH